ncbi:MAG TPA: hypothetical protein VKA48_13385, partial [Gammaproteobacteria bacterium]|nr:hypothetical protein [Gammaproteobacteria bacterium]
LGVTDYTNGASANGIGGSRHNLGAYGLVIHTDGTTEICVFCHTPHHGSTNAPLWNRGAQTTSYTAYGGTLGGTTVGAPGGATLACLSCHDGVNTFDTLVNAPGKGNGTGNNTTATDMGWQFVMPDGHGPVTHWAGWDNFGCDTGCHPESSPSGPTRLNIGTTLANDHPVSVTYKPGTASLRPTSTVIANIDLTEGLANTTTAYPDNISQNRWAVGGSISATATIADLLRGGKVECSSCHDPHFSNKSWDEVEGQWEAMSLLRYEVWCTGEDCTDGNFLRRVGGNTGSGVCRTCHNK